MIIISTFSAENLSLYLERPWATPRVIILSSYSESKDSKLARLNLITLISSSMLSFCLHFTPKLSVMSFPSFLSATAIYPSISFSTIFLFKNFDRDFGILPFMSLLMHLNASDVLLNLWKSSKVILYKQTYTIFAVLQYLRSIFASFRLSPVSWVCRIERERSRQQSRIRSTLLFN